MVNGQSENQTSVLQMCQSSAVARSPPNPKLSLLLPANFFYMRPIQMVDLKTQYHQLKNEIDTAVLDVFESSAFINGNPVQQFCDALAAYLDVKHVIPCANGTDALQIAMMALNLQPGDEVITPSFTYIATTEVVALLRLKPVFCRSG